jgi:hypothetical protein
MVEHDVVIMKAKKNIRGICYLSALKTEIFDNQAPNSEVGLLD